MPDWDGAVRCEVLKVEPYKRLRYTWCGGAEASRLNSTVTWTLEATEAGTTRLRLEHAGFTDKNGFAFEGMGRNWRGNVARQLEGVLAGLVAGSSSEE